MATKIIIENDQDSLPNIGAILATRENTLEYFANEKNKTDAQLPIKNWKKSIPKKFLANLMVEMLALDEEDPIAKYIGNKTTSRTNAVQEAFVNSKRNLIFTKKAIDEYKIKKNIEQ